MDRAELLEELKTLMGEYMEPSEKPKLATLTDDTSFIDDIHMDSIDMVDVVIKVENKYGISIKNETIPQLNTVGKCLDAIQEKLGEKGK
jgi:acyl carrier protein